MTVRTIAKSLYGFFGILFVVGGASVLLVRTGLLPDSATDLILRVTDGSANTLHIAQEFSSLAVFAGLISFWFIRHYEQSVAFHWAMIAFWFLFALVHWIDARGGRSMAGPLINTIPFALFAITAVLRRFFERRAVMTGD